MANTERMSSFQGGKRPETVNTLESGGMDPQLAATLALPMIVSNGCPEGPS